MGRLSVSATGELCPTFTYDADGNLRKLEGPKNIVYIGGIYEKNLDSGEVTKHYHTAAGERIAMNRGGSVNFFVNDHLGGTSLVMNVSGNVVSRTRYYPYGQGWTQDAGTTPPTDRLYTGQRQYGPKSGIYDYGSRFYSADIGRFLQADTIVPGAANPQALNRYSYVLNNPLRDTDPTGHGWMIDPIFPGGGEGGGGSGGGGPGSSGAGDGGASSDLGTSIGWGMEFEAGVQGFGWQSSHRTGLSFSNFYFDCVLHRNPCDYFGSPCDGFLCHVFNYVLAAAMLVPVAPEAGEVTAADLAGGQLTKVAAGVSGREAGGILANKAAGDAARNAIAARYPGSVPERVFQTPLGSRRIDVLTEEGLAIESKVGRVPLTTSVQQQIAKDQWLLTNEKAISAIRWEFTRSGVTGRDRSYRSGGGGIESGRNPMGVEAMSIDWNSYEIYDPGVVGLLDSLPRSTARQAFDQLMAAKPARIEMLRSLVRANGVALGTTDTAVQDLNDWFRANLEPDPNKPGRLLPEWYSVVNDISLFLGDLMIARCPGLRWEFYIWGKKDVSYQRHVIMGFTDSPNPKVNVDIDRWLATYAHRIVASRGSIPHYGSATVRGVEIDIDAASASMPEREIEKDAFLSWLRNVEQRC